MRHEGSLHCEITKKGRKYKFRVAVIETEKLRPNWKRHYTFQPINQINQLEDLNLTAPSPDMKCKPAAMKLKPDAKPMFCRARIVPLASQDQVTYELAKLEAQGLI